MTPRKVSASHGLVRVISLWSLSVFGCAHPQPAIDLADQLLENERIQYAARQEDWATSVRMARSASAVLRESCRETLRLRTDLLEEQLEALQDTLRLRFEFLAWRLLWEDYPRASERILAPLSGELDRAIEKQKAAAVAAAEWPNDALLAARSEAATAESAELRGERLRLEFAGAYALAGRVQVIRESVDRRIRREIEFLRERVLQWKALPCPDPEDFATDWFESRQNDYATLHSLQVEGLVALRGHLDKPDALDLLAIGAAEALSENAPFLVRGDASESEIEAHFEVLRERIRAAQENLMEMIDSSLEALRVDIGPNS